MAKPPFAEMIDERRREINEHIRALDIQSNEFGDGMASAFWQWSVEACLLELLRAERRRRESRDKT